MRRRLSAEETLGLHVTIGVLVMIAGAFCFSEIAEHLGDTTAQVALDHRVTNWFHLHAQPRLTVIALVITFFGSVSFVTFVSVVCAIYFTIHQAWNRLIALLLTIGGGSLLNLLLKHFFHRQRPVLENPLVTLGSFGFPSGHTMGSTLLYGLLALIAARFIKQLEWRVVVFIAASVMVALIGLSRIYLGAHFLTDVLAAIAIGIAWLTFCWTTTETFRKHSRRRQSAPKV
ncbi:MAG: phosphatase PAP2 family protein [Chthoniobacterales bacterium]